MKNSFDIYTYDVKSSTYVDEIISEIRSNHKEYLLVHLSAFIHNTVLSHNFTTALNKSFENIEIVKLKHDDKNSMHVTVYTSDTILDDQKDVLLEEVYHNSSNLSESLNVTSKNMLDRFFIDSLTNLPNIYKLRDVMLDDENQTMIVISLDNFKDLNDFYGYLVGDFIIENFSKKINLLLEEEETLYRLNSTEFAIVHKNKMNFFELKEYLNDLYNKISNNFCEYISTKIYLDITLASSHSVDSEHTFSKVSMALKYAKNRHLPFWIYEESGHFENIYENNLIISNTIRVAIESKKVLPYFQPIIDNVTEEIFSYECLARIVDDNGIIYLPDTFLPLAKKSKLYHQITKTIIEKSFEVFSLNSYHFSINLSIEDIMNNEMYDYILDKLANCNFASRVTFELLESDAIDDFKKVNQFFTEVKRHGSSIAIDDFGNGYSNFSYLTKLDVDYIKLDEVLIEDIDTNKNSYLVTKTIVNFAKELGIKVVAEYVHSSSILSIIKSLGIEYSQGFYIDKPKVDIKL